MSPDFTPSIAEKPSVGYPVAVADKRTQDVECKAKRAAPSSSKAVTDERPRNATVPIPEPTSSWCSQLVMAWLTPLIRLGFKRPLQDHDMYKMYDGITAKHNSQLFQEQWRSQSSTPSVARALWGCFGTRWLIAGFAIALHVACQLVSPLILESLLNFLSREEKRVLAGGSMPSRSFGYTMVAALFGLQIVSVLANSAFFMSTRKIGLCVKNALTTAIYRKTLVLSARARAGDFNEGKLQNIVSTDAERLNMVVPYLHMVWSLPIQVTVILILLVRLVGPAAFVAFGLMVAFIPAQSHMLRRLASIRKQSQIHTDTRVRLTNETLANVKTVKLMGWELIKATDIMNLREEELASVKRLALWRNAINAVSKMIPTIAAMVVFMLVYMTGGQLSVTVVFTALALFNQLRLPLFYFPTMIPLLIDSRVALRRVTDLLLAEELTSLPDIVSSTPLPDVPAISISDADFEWAQDQPTLSNISLDIPAGVLVAVVGQVGSGKSSLLSGILGEMHRTRGSVQIAGSVAYCPQQAWIMNCTLRENIVWGSEFDEAKYRRAIRLSCLERDIEQLGGDLIEIGERGQNLSGGQRQRLQTARAIYADSDIYLFDDCLSALDSHVGAAVFHSAIAGALQGRTRILVTHALHFLPHCDMVVYLRDGRIAEQGTFAQLMADKNSAFAEQMRAYGGLEEDQDTADGMQPPMLAPDDADTSEVLAVLQSKDQDEIVVSKPIESATDGDKVGKAQPQQQLTQAEERAVGSVKKSVFSAYMTAIGGQVTASNIMVWLVLTQLCRTGGDVWLSFWTSKTFPRVSDQVYLWVYFAWGIGQLVSLLISGTLFVYAGVRASRDMHGEVVQSLLRSPMSFFDQTPHGRIINRISKDQDAMDNTLADAIKQFLQTLFITLSTFAVMILSTPLFAIPLVPLLIVYYFVQLFYRRTSRELKRLEALSRSPLFAQYAETLSGTVTIRAYQSEDRFIQRNQELIDRNSSPYFLQFAAQRWLALRLESIGSVMVFFAGFFGVLGLGSVPASLVGLSMSYALSVTSTLAWCVRQATETETQMNSVERLSHYAHNLESEAPLVTNVCPPTPEWPEHGEIEFQDVVMSYRRGLDPVLKGVSFRVPAASKVGIVGRTGSGKSTTLVALFRLVELLEGKILIDGVDISQLGLADLRSRMAIVGQEPTLFSGTIRTNLDPEGLHDDAHLWNCLESAGLKDWAESLDAKLDTPLTDTSCLSLGQAQLLNLARARVRNSRILVLDEASSSCDMETDAYIQRSIRRDFAGATVLTIAHRLNTVIDFDFILALDAGKVVEFGSPADLLERPESLFSSLVEETGAANASVLRQMAMDAREGRCGGQSS
ncbi:P-loop containing nucleoside triphosphate hydrolase protein [Catenaria anguillulae PL171]|uniref:p-loop containing nucleoside triphosphate hydrolase protein n=1 Tax=Catenaria anguillulae PL171 TaxID=765915 RepID=A0A1Y2HLI8_9FUNG|nr:P-loop containing nucleoside triphosphate hydrolase protein [Catenaria anguillulae PL171]